MGSKVANLKRGSRGKAPQAEGRVRAKAQTRDVPGTASGWAGFGKGGLREWEDRGPVVERCQPVPSSSLNFTMKTMGSHRRVCPGYYLRRSTLPHVSERPGCCLHLHLKTLRLKEEKSFVQEQTIRKMSEIRFEIEPHLTPSAGRQTRQSSACPRKAVLGRRKGTEVGDRGDQAPCPPPYRRTVF